MVVAGHGDIAIVHRPGHLFGIVGIGGEFPAVRDDGVEECLVESAELVKDDLVEEIPFLCARPLLTVDGDGTAGGDLHGVARGVPRGLLKDDGKTVRGLAYCRRAFEVGRDEEP